jgi:ABC-2 type transport system ATP-binding protein
MQVRLAFSIAIRSKSDILVLDEVLAVGDEAFQKKCTDIFEKYKLGLAFWFLQIVMTFIN